LIARNRNVDVLEIMLARASHDYVGHMYPHKTKGQGSALDPLGPEAPDPQYLVRGGGVSILFFCAKLRTVDAKSARRLQLWRVV
jgi:hypothetical protein